MKESDWKLFKKIKEKAIEKFCDMALNEFREAMDKEDEHIHERYLLHFELVQNRNEQMALIFDGQSRSKAHLQLLSMRSEGLADEDLVAQLSEEFRDRTNPTIRNW